MTVRNDAEYVYMDIVGLEVCDDRCLNQTRTI